MKAFNLSIQRRRTVRLQQESPLPRERMQYIAFNLSSVRGPTMQTGASWLVPAPRLELHYGRAEKMEFVEDLGPNSNFAFFPLIRKKLILETTCSKLFRLTLEGFQNL